MKKLEGIVLIVCVVYAVVFLVFPHKLQAQNLNGTWQGDCKKWEDSNIAFAMEMEISQSSTGETKGTSKIAYKKEAWYCEKQFEGKVNQNKFYFEDKQFITHQHEVGSYWLVLNGTLTYDKEKDELRGWVDAYDPKYNEYFKRHDYIILRRIDLITL